MFVRNPESVHNAYVCGKIKADYLIKHFNLLPFYFNKNLYYFIIKDSNNIEIPWYIKILK